jgi:hypothetical protein
LFSVSRRILAFLCLAGLLTGCAFHKPALRTYRLVKQNASEILIPPGVAGPDVAQGAFTADVIERRVLCPPAPGIVALTVRKKRVVVTVNRNMLVRQPPGWLSAWTAGLEEQGCVAPGGGLRLADWIAESLPLTPDAAFHLLHPSPGQTGQVDLGPQTRLQLVSPILREGASPDAPLLETVETTGSGYTLNVTARATGNAIGYETAWYAVRAKTCGVGFMIAPLDAERNIQGKTEHRSQPAANYLQFPPDAAFYRLFYKTDQTEFTALVVGARTRPELEQDGEMLLPRLAVSRLYHGRPAPVKFDRSSPAILDLVLTGGETISWK